MLIVVSYGEWLCLCAGDSLHLLAVSSRLQRCIELSLPLGSGCFLLELIRRAVRSSGWLFYLARGSSSSHRCRLVAMLLAGICLAGDPCLLLAILAYGGFAWRAIAATLWLGSLPEVIRRERSASQWLFHLVCSISSSYCCRLAADGSRQDLSEGGLCLLLAVLACWGFAWWVVAATR